MGKRARKLKRVDRTFMRLCPPYEFRAIIRAIKLNMPSMSGQHIFAIQLQKVRAAITALIAEGILPAGIDQSRLAVEPSREVGHGDLATNAAMVLAKEARSKPRPIG